MRKGTKAADEEYVKLMNSTSEELKKRQSSKKNKQKRSLRATKVVNTNFVPTTALPLNKEVHIKMFSDEEELTREDEAKDLKIKSAATKVVRGGKTYNGDSNSVIILDSGTEWTVVGGHGWKVVKTHDRHLDIATVHADSAAVSMVLCDAVTMVQDKNGNPALFGIRKMGYSHALTNNEAVVNNHLIQEAGMILDSVAKRHGGAQELHLSHDHVLLLEYDPNRYKMFLSCRKPTDNDIENLDIHWVSCHDYDLKVESGTAIARLRPIAHQPPKLHGAPEQDDPATVSTETAGLTEKKDQDATFHKANKHMAKSR